MDIKNLLKKYFRKKKRIKKIIELSRSISYVYLRSFPYLMLFFTFRSGTSRDIKGNYVFLDHVALLCDRRVSELYF